MPAGGKTSGGFKSSVIDGRKKCPACQQWFDVEVLGFRICKGRVYAKPICKPCMNAAQRKARQNNPELRQANYRKHRKWADKNKVRMAEYAREYRKRNASIVNDNRKKKHKKRMANDIEYRITRNLRNRLWDGLRCKAGNPGIIKTEDLIGCSIEEFRKHIESQFESWMTWENYGKFTWNIDHKIPVASFDMTDPIQQKKCFHWSNMQPLHWRKNIIKGDKILVDNLS